MTRLKAGIFTNYCISTGDAIYSSGMDMNVLIGCVVTVCALALIFALVLWCRRTINRIAKYGFHTARQTLKELNGDR